jgi:citrate synthase
MGEEVLFQITQSQLETGLRGCPVGYCTTSFVDANKGLFYIDRPVHEVVFWQPQQVIFLLYHGREGSEKEVKDFYADLQRRAVCSKETIQAIYNLPRAGHSMSMFAEALLILGNFECKGDYREDCLNLIAKAPHLAAAVINHHAGWGETPAPKKELGYMENFTKMLKVPEKTKEDLLTQTFRLFNILHYDHGGGNLSAFVGKAVASGLADMYGSMAAAMCALAGPRHGRANQDCLEFVQEACKQLGENATPRQVEMFIRQRLEKNQLVYGFGHAVLRVEDPRATVFYNYVQKYFPDHPLVKMSLLLRTEGSKVLSENPKISDPHPNIDAISGVTLTVSGFPYPEYYTILFGLARIVGISIQIVYERTEARGGKGTPIIRPKYLFKRR